MGLLTTTAEVDAKVSETDGMVQAVEGQALVLAASDQAGWTGVYNGWQQTKKDWEQAKAGSVLPGSVYGGGILDQCAAAQGQVAAYRAKIAGGGGIPPVGPVPPVAPIVAPTSPTTWPTWAKVTGGVAAAGVVLVIVDKVSSIVKVFKR